MKKRSIVIILTVIFFLPFLYSENLGNWTTIRIGEASLNRREIKKNVKKIGLQEADGFYVLLDSVCNNGELDRARKNKIIRIARYVIKRAKKNNLQMGVRMSDWEFLISGLYNSIEPCGRIVVSETVGAGKELFGPDRSARGYVPITLNFTIDKKDLSYNDIALLCFPAKYKRGRLFNNSETIPQYVPLEEIVDFSKNIEKSGDSTVIVTLPRGEWRFLRLGYVVDPALSPINRLNKDAAYVVAERWFSNFIGSLEKNRYKGVITRTVIDFTFENSRIWIDSFKKEFESRRGYELTNSDLLLYAGYFIQDKETTDKLTVDIFSTLMEVIDSNYYGVFDNVATNHGCDLFINTVWTNSARIDSEWSPRRFMRE
ncbi:MAG TPA: glycosyl hydrolase [Bacteroidaceae bacterium]|nr:glycosyl hydrolase [Bacteroidaceae bacterium]